MDTTRTEETGRRTLADAAADLVATAADAGEKARRTKQNVEDAIEDGMRATRHAVRRGRHAAEDLAAETTLRVRQRPLESVGLAFVVGLCLGGTVMYAIARLGRSTPRLQE
jgi:ElaB/YqjD/DUF883 family membrane-anchored ribosome-binding protein